MLGTILAPVQMMMTVGLYMAGRKDVALLNMKLVRKSLTEVPGYHAQPSMKKERKQAARGRPRVDRNAKPVPGGYCSWAVPSSSCLPTCCMKKKKQTE